MGFFGNGQKAANQGHKAVDTQGMSAAERAKTEAGKSYQEQQNANKNK